jgi:hypothetical protein
MPKRRYLQGAVRRAANLTGKHPDTIRRWAKAGLDLSDVGAVLELSNDRGHFRHKRHSVRVRNGLSLDILGKLPAPDERGAVGALKRLQRLEILFHDRLNEEIKNGGDPVTVSAASSDYTRLTESLRKYEKEVEMARRDLGHLLPKGEAVEAVKTVANWLRLTWMAWISSALDDVRSAPDTRHAKKVALHAFDEILVLRIQNFKKLRCPVPDWADEVILEEFRLFHLLPDGHPKRDLKACATTTTE